MNRVRGSNARRSLKERIARGVRRRLARSWTELPGEIIGDDFAAWIQKLAAESSTRTMVEIGAGTGDGSTRAFVAGAETQTDPPVLFSIEASPTRAEELRTRYAHKPFVHTCEAASAPPDAYMSEVEAIEWHYVLHGDRNAAESVAYKRDLELRNLKEWGVPTNAVEQIRATHGITHFDVALLDGSGFTGTHDLSCVYGARWLLLDDIWTPKNHGNCVSLLGDSNYELVATEANVRNGYAVFRWVGDGPPTPMPE
ncbi:MAG: hypothetical protein ACR2LX_02730 [Jatrophihabitans sp.]